MTEQTDKKPLSNAPNFNELELGVLEFWNKENIFEQSLKQTENGEPFVFFDGPPFATGTPHYGHILGSTIKDAVGRYQTMKGRYVRRVWGWDCHGLPIENIVEEKLKISGKKQIEEIGVDKFNEECRASVMTYVDVWGKTVNRMGRWVDFENSYKTMDSKYMESVWWALQQIWNKGLIYEDNKVLMYCSRCETPLSNFEVAMDNSYKDVTEESVFVKFQLHPKQRILDTLTDEKTFVLAWTTTPWTLPGNTALNIGPDIAYVLVKQNDEKFILAKERLEILSGEYEQLLEFSSRSLEGLSYQPLFPEVLAQHPDLATAHKIYAEDYVTTTDGTGVVHNAAMYGEVDYEAAKKRGLPRQHILDNKGIYNNAMPERLQGLYFKDADKVVLRELEEKGLVYKIENNTHSYPHCWRCGTPLYYSALSAWFVNIQKVKTRLLELNQDINWYPDHLKNGRFAKSVEMAPDWNISRNRYWATALPFWKCTNDNCEDVVCVGSVEELKQKANNFDQVYPQYDPNNVEAIDLHKPYIDKVELRCEKCSSIMIRVPEVVDCWVESASMPFAELHYPFDNNQLFQDRYPGDFVAEYIAQTRAWFYVMHVIGTIIFDKAPFKNVVTTGTILAEDGNKMSKSKKNFPDPNVIFEKLGVDSVRYLMLTSTVMNADDYSFSEKAVTEVNRKLSMILYNVWQFFRMYHKGHIKEASVPSTTNVLDVWVLSKLHQTQKLVTEYLNNYNTVKAGREIQDLINEVSTWYVRRSRDRMRGDGLEAQAALETLGYVLVQISKMLAPFMPFLSEHLYKDLTGEKSVHLAKWSEVNNFSEQALTEMIQVRKLVELGLFVRKEQNLKVRQPLAELQYVLPESGSSLDKSLGKILQEELNVKNVVSAGELVEREGWVGKTADNVSLAFDTVLSEELVREGLARELERQVQDLRKKSGLRIGETVDLYYATTNAELVTVVTEFLDKKKTFVGNVISDPEIEADFETQTTVNGEAIWLGLVKN